MYPDSEILFPYRAIKGLAHLRGPLWQRLVQHILQLPEDHPDVIAFSLLIMRLADCLHCDQGSYKAYLGCQMCSQRIVSGFKGTDEDFIYLYEEAREDVRRYLEEGVPPPPEHLVPVKVRPIDAMELAEEATRDRSQEPDKTGWELLDELLERFGEIDDEEDLPEDLSPHLDDEPLDDEDLDL